MPKRILALTVKEIKKLKDGRHAVGGVANLYADIRDHSVRFWLLRDQVNKKNNLTYSGDLSLEQARDQARRDIELRRQGRDPRAERKALVEAKKRLDEEVKLQDLEANSTLQLVTDRWFKKESVAGRWTTNGERKEYNRIKKYIFPTFGNRPISTITPQAMADLFNVMLRTRHNTARRIEHYLRLIFSWAKVCKKFGRVESPFNDEFEELVRTAKANKPLQQNRPALPYAEIPKFIKVLLEKGDPVSLAIVFSILTATRNMAVRLATWKEIDFKNATWVIPKEHDKMKSKDPSLRTVFLSKQAIALLKSLPRPTGDDDEIIFPPMLARPFKPMTDNTIGKHIRTMHAEKLKEDGVGWVDPAQVDDDTGLPMRITQHGTARAGLQTWAMDTKNYDANAVDLCLFHKIDDNLKKAYKRGTMEARRKKIMQDWADHCLKGIKLSNYPPKC